VIRQFVGESQYVIEFHFLLDDLCPYFSKKYQGVNENRREGNSLKRERRGRKERKDEGEEGRKREEKEEEERKKRRKKGSYLRIARAKNSWNILVSAKSLQILSHMGLRSSIVNSRLKIMRSQRKQKIMLRQSASGKRK
jgi:hypothetical protein